MPASRPITGINLSTGAPYSALAWGDGVHDDQPILQAAWNSCGLIKLPAGIYRVDTPLVGPNVDGAGIMGDGAGVKLPASANTAGTIIRATFESGTVIESHTSINHPTFQGLVIERAIAPISGCGLDMGVSSDQALLSDLWLVGHAVGLRLRTTGYAKAEYVRSERNTGNGIEVVGQWQLDRIFSAVNGGCGFEVSPALPGGNSLGQWKGLSTYGNASHGLALKGFPGQGCYCMRLSDSFFGGDGGYEVFIDSHSTGNTTVLTNVFVEAGRLGGFLFTEDAGWISMLNCVASCNGNNGISSSAPFLSIQGGGFHGHTTGYGILIVAGRASVQGVNAQLNQYGIGGSVNCPALTYLGNWLSNNSLGPTVIHGSVVQYSGGNF